MIDELKQLNDTFYKIFDELKEARPSLAGCDEAFLSMAQKILDQYELEYRLLDLKHRVDTEREIARLEARYDRLVPFRWKSRWLHKPKQNYAATLVDIEADEEMKAFFKDCEEEIAAQYLTGEPPHAEQSEDEEEEFEYIIDEDPAEVEEGASEGAENAPESDSEGGAPQKDEVKVEGSAENAPESDSEGTKQANSEEESNPPKKRARRKKEKKGEEENACVGSQT